MFEQIPPAMLSWRRALQFAPDGSLDPAWFRSFEESRYGGENSIDVQAIDRPAGSYDLISASSVLEFVPDDRKAFAELVRIGSAECILHLTFVPTNTDRPSSHYEQPVGPYGRYHDYGLDLDQWFGAAAHGLRTVPLRATDPITNQSQLLFFFCRRGGDAELLEDALSSKLPGSVALRTSSE